MKKISLIRYEEDWKFFATVIGSVDDVQVFYVEYRNMSNDGVAERYTGNKMIIWTITVRSLDAIELSETIYNWDKKVYELYVGELVDFANRVFKE
jgi:hypothetical protein